MESVIFSKNQFKKLNRLDIDNEVTNTEGEIFLFDEKNNWEKELKVLKKMYIDEGEVFGNKLYTITSLMENKDKFADLNLVLPEKMALVGKELIGYTMPYIDGINLATLLKDNRFSEKDKLLYLKQVGELLNKMKNVREYQNMPDFFLNDLHEGNFILDKKDNQIKAVDMDSCKINGNKPAFAKYLAPTLNFAYLGSKYKISDEERMGFYIPDENTDLYCYSIMLLNYFYNGKIRRLENEDFYDYLTYLIDIKFPVKMIDIFSDLYTPNNNSNPYLYLDELPKDFLRADSRVFKALKK